MTDKEAMEFALRVRSCWPSSFMDEAMLAHWNEYFQKYSVDEVAGALTRLLNTHDKIPPMRAFTEYIEGAKARRFKCPKCGLGFPSEARVEEHESNIHWED